MVIGADLGSCLFFMGSRAMPYCHKPASWKLRCDRLHFGGLKEKKLCRRRKKRHVSKLEEGVHEMYRMVVDLTCVAWKVRLAAD